MGALVSGWGLDSDSASSISPVLRKVEAPVMSQSECESYWGNLNEGIVCINTEGGHSSCNGDSSGPLSIPGSVYEQIGIVSFGSALVVKSELLLDSLKSPNTLIGSLVSLD